MIWKSHYIRILVTVSIILVNILNGTGAEDTLNSPLLKAGGWSTPSPSGWAEPVAPSSISLGGAAEVSGSASAYNQHSGFISASAGWAREGRQKLVQEDPVARYYFERDP